MAQLPNIRLRGLRAVDKGFCRPGVPALAPILGLVLFLSGCAGPQGKPAEEATPEDYCRSRGFEVGSAAYGDCIEHQKQLGAVRFFSREQMIRPR